MIRNDKSNDPPPLELQQPESCGDVDVLTGEIVQITNEGASVDVGNVNPLFVNLNEFLKIQTSLKRRFRVGDRIRFRRPNTFMPSFDFRPAVGDVVNPSRQSTVISRPLEEMSLEERRAYYATPEFTQQLTQHMHRAKKAALKDRDEQSTGA